MKTSNRYTIKAEKIHSLKDLELEKQKLRLEILKKEQDISSGYTNILHALSPRHLATSVLNDFTASTSIFTRAVSIGKSLMAKRK